jgi:hypothetical protein
MGVRKEGGGKTVDFEMNIERETTESFQTTNKNTAKTKT